MEDKILISNIEGKIAHTQRYSVVTHTNFLDPYQVTVIRTTKGTNHYFFGGYEGAERKMLFFLPEYLDEPEIDQYVKLITVTPQNAEGLGHRDYLGSILGLGIKRDKIGDMIVHDDSCDFFVMADIAEYIASNLDKVARMRVKCEIKLIDALRPPTSNAEAIRIIVASLRLDCIIAGVYKLSRNEAASLITAKKVHVNWQVVEDISKQVKEGDMISLRGKGRFTMQSITGNTKKGNLVLECLKNG